MRTKRTTRSKLALRLFAVFLSALALQLPATASSPPAPPNTQPEKTYTPPAVDDKRAVILTEVHGNVFKRGFIDFIRQIFGDPTPAKLNDKLHDGTQVGTGSDSWAQLTWPEVIARTWANTVVQIMPNKRIVYLADGEMLFRLKKDSDASSDYSIWTKVLQTRVRGTSLILQRTPNVTRLTVLEGHVEVKNLIDQSELALGPGAVYEVRTPFEKPKENKNEDGTKKPVEQTQWDENFQPVSPRRLVIGESPTKTSDWTEDAKALQLPANELSMPIEEIDLFKTPSSQSCLKVADAQSLSDNPLLKDFPEKIDSAQLIEDTLKKLPDVCFRDRLSKVGNPLAERNRLLGKEASVSCGPAGTGIKVGSDLGYQFALPSPVKAGEKPERLPITHTGSSTPINAPTHNSFSASQFPAMNPHSDLGKCQAAWKAYNDFKQCFERDKQSKCNQLRAQENFCSSEECQRKKDMLYQWERDQQARLHQLEQEAKSAQERADKHIMHVNGQR